MFGGSKKKAAVQTKAKQQKPVRGIMGRTGGAPSNPAAGSGGGPAKPADGPVKRNLAEETVTIGSAAAIYGDITGKGDLAICGRVEGSVDLPDNNANIEANGFMDGGIRARSVNIRGKVQGDIDARSKVTIFATGAVIGTIMAPRIQIEDGGKFKGRIDMGLSKPATTPEPKKASSPAPAPTASSG